MRPSRQFRPHALVALEDRITPSQTTAFHTHVAAAAAAKPPAPTFQLDIADTIAAGLPVAENRTVRYNGGAIQTESWQINPDTSNSTVDTTKTINLPNNGGTAQVLDFTYSNGNNSSTEVITTYEPNGSVQTETITSQPAGNVTQLSGFGSRSPARASSSLIPERAPSEAP